MMRTTPFLAAARGTVLTGALLCAALPVARAQPVAARNTDSVRAPATAGVPASAAGAAIDYPLGAGDVIRVGVFQNPELSLEARVSETGSISYPLIGLVKLAGLTAAQAEQAIAARLREGRFLQNPQVTVNVAQFRSQQVSVLGTVNRPGRYPIELTGTRLSEVLAQAGGAVPGVGADTVVLMTERDGRPARLEIDVAEMFLRGDRGADVVLKAGDSIYVHRAPVFYVYGQVQRPGMYTIERGMTVAQALAKGGGLTLRGTERALRLQRRDERGQPVDLSPALTDTVRADDLLFVKESLF